VQHRQWEDSDLALLVRALPRRLIWNTEHLIERAVSEDSALRAVILVARGEQRVREIETDYHAQDVWENEGGAQAYA
jgi:hypothetical protein